METERRPLRELVDEGLERLGANSLAEYVEDMRVQFNEVCYDISVEEGRCDLELTLSGRVKAFVWTWQDEIRYRWNRHVACKIRGHDLIDTSPPNCGESGAFQITCQRCGWTRNGYMTGFSGREWGHNEWW